MTTTPRVWVGCLGCYNCGNLVGLWLDAADAPQDVKDWGLDVFERTDHQLPREHFADAHEELWVFDHEGFDGILTGECSPVTAAEIAEALEQIGDDDRPAFAAFCSDQGETPNADNLADLIERFIDHFCGYWDREADYAEELAEDIGALTERELSWPLTCIDWDRAWDELRIGGDNWSEYVSGHGYAIFRSY